MARTGFRLILLFVLVLFVVGPQHAAAQCVSAYANGFTGPSWLNNEGHTERPADIKITAGGTNCFSSGNTISVTYSGILTIPTSLTNLSTNNIVITNPNATADGALVLGVTTTSGISSSGPQTVIQMEVLGATTDPAASITLQNLRFDVTGLAGTIAVPAALNSFVSGSSAGLTGVSAKQVGSVEPTMDLSFSKVTTGAGTQSSAGPLTANATVKFQTAAGWPTSPFRVAIAKPAYPTGCVGAACTDTVDIPTGDTSLVIDIENIPSGVTVTLPATMSIWPGVGAATPTFQWKLRTSVNSSGIVQGIYDTVIAPAGAAVASVTIKTGPAALDATAGSAGPPAVAATPITFGVEVGASSGNGWATIRVVFGPGLSAAFVGDDANAAAVPVYTPFISTAGVGREIITDSSLNPPTASDVDTAPTDFFYIAPTQSVVLFQYVTDESGYQTGLAVTNSGEDDKTLFSTKGQTGPVVFYLYNAGAAAPIIYQVKAADGRGLDANGNLEPGNVFAASLDTLLTASGNSALAGKFSGYVIALCEFDYGHGFDIVFNSNGVGTAVNALYLGSSLRLDVPNQGLGQ